MPTDENHSSCISECIFSYFSHAEKSSRDTLPCRDVVCEMRPKRNEPKAARNEHAEFFCAVSLQLSESEVFISVSFGRIQHLCERPGRSAARHGE